MKILLVSDHEYLPDRVGGRESSTHDIAGRLVEKGHNVTVLCREIQPNRPFSRRPLIGPMKTAAIKLIRLTRPFRTAYRIVRFPQTDGQDFLRLLEKEAPDICVCQVHRPFPYLLAAHSAGIPQLVYVRDCESVEHIVEAGAIETAGFIANSKFVADWCSNLLNREIPYCYPIIEPSRYRAENGGDGNTVLFINPIPGKGLDTALAVAGLCPEIPFIFLEGWPLEVEQKSRLLKELAKERNIQWYDATFNMKEIYRQARLILVPSQWPEAFGRVIVEAQINGIPAVASDIGGLPEAVGRAGVLVPPDAEPGIWAEAVSRLWYNKQEYSLHRHEALLAAEREQLSPDYLTVQLESLLLEAATSVR